MKLLILSLALLWATIEISRAEDVRVSERCTERDCFIAITGPASHCLEDARAKQWSSGFAAAVAIRNCLDKGNSK